MKQPWIAVSVSTAEALMIALEHQISVFCLEDMPYRDYITGRYTPGLFEDYHCIDYPHKHIAIFKKIRGKNRFNDDLYRVYHCYLND